MNLWKDRVNTEVSVAVLHSFYGEGVSIVDHHTQADQFMEHFRAEFQLRGGCPADWVWIVPPVGGGLTQVSWRLNMRCSFAVLICGKRVWAVFGGPKVEGGGANLQNVL